MRNKNNDSVEMKNSSLPEKEEFLKNSIPSISTVDYDKDYWFTAAEIMYFDKHPYNRESSVKDALVKSYANEMLNGNWLWNISIIYVGIKSKGILNGWNRRNAIEIVLGKNPNAIEKVKVKFVDDSTEEKTKALIRILNGGKHYNTDDMINTLIAEGNEDYIRLEKFAMDEDHVQLHKNKPYWNKAGVLVCGSYKAFKDGYMNDYFPADKKDWDTAEQRYQEVIRIKKALNYDAVGQDCWQYICEAWYDIFFDKNQRTKINALPNGIESFYEELHNCDNSNSNKPQEWYDRFVATIENAYQKRYDVAL